MKFKHLIYTLLFLFFGGFITYRIIANKAKNDNSKEKDGTKKQINVSGIVVKPQTFENNLSISGSVEANEQVEIRSEISGMVENIYFQEGSNVSKGQVLFKVNDLELKAQLQQAKTKENLASENERRAKLLLQKEAISQEEYDVAKADLKSAQAQVQLINAQISKTAVKAPFSGRIGLRAISPGTYISPNILVANLFNISKIKITFSVPEKYASQINTNTNISFTIPNSTEEYNAKIYAIEPGIQLNTRTLKVRALTNNNDEKLFPGTFVNINLPLNVIKNAVLVPSEAIVPIQDGKKVFISKNGKATEIKIETANRTDASILVLSGLKQGDTLITNGVMSLKQDTPVKVKIN